VVGGYLARWRIEETIRFIKQSYRLEDIRVMTYRRLKNLVALVLAACYFSAVYLCEGLKLRILARRVLKWPSASSVSRTSITMPWPMASQPSYPTQRSDLVKSISFCKKREPSACQ